MFHWRRLLRDHRFMVARCVVYRHENNVWITTELRKLFVRSLWYYIFVHDQFGISNRFPNELYSLKKSELLTTKTALNLVCSVFSWILHVSGNFRFNAPSWGTPCSTLLPFLVNICSDNTWSSPTVLFIDILPRV